MSAMRSIFTFRQPFQRSHIMREVKRMYARGSSLLDDGNISIDRVPSRLKRRLAKQGLSVEDYLRSSPTAVPASDIPAGHRDTMAPPASASAGFPETADGLKMLLKDMSGDAPTPLPSDESSEQFPSDSKKYRDWRRDQSRKAFRPGVDPSQTSIILFPGQGSQFVGMGNDTLGYGQARDLFEEASAVLKYDLLKLCLSGPLPSLSKTVHCQPAILVCSLAAIEKLQEQNPEVLNLNVTACVC